MFITALLPLMIHVTPWYTVIQICDTVSSLELMKFNSNQVTITDIFKKTRSSRISHVRWFASSIWRTRSIVALVNLLKTMLCRCFVVACREPQSMTRQRRRQPCSKRIWISVLGRLMVPGTWYLVYGGLYFKRKMLCSASYSGFLNSQWNRILTWSLSYDSFRQVPRISPALRETTVDVIRPEQQP